MNDALDLKKLERRAFRSTYQDGLWDIYIGCALGSMALLTFLPESNEFPWLNFLLFILALAASYFIFWAGKKFITLPRLGQAKFGAERIRRKRTLAVILGVIVALQVAVFLATVLLWARPELVSRLDFLPADPNAETLLVASIGALFVGPSLALMAYFKDFLRGYYIAILMAAAVFMMILFDEPLYLLAAAALIMLPGIVLFFRFLRSHPLPPEEVRGV